MDDAVETKRPPFWMQWDELRLAEDFKRRHERIFFITMLVAWDEYEALLEDHPEAQVWEQIHGDAFVHLAMTPFEFYDYSAWYFMDRHARAKRECAFCGETIFNAKNKAFCSIDHWLAYMRRDFKGKS